MMVMMKEKIDWTVEQRDVIIAKDCNLLVAAAAGAGKTAVLVERIIRKIMDQENPMDIDRMLIVTFTNAAAAEMRERIGEAIAAVLEKNPGSKNIQRQLILLNKASITTMHSFCLEVVRSNFQSINIDPVFRISDETEAALMRFEVLNELFEDRYEKETDNQDYFELLECYGGNRDDQILQDMVLNLNSFTQSSPWPEKWLNEMMESFNTPMYQDFGETSWGRVLLQSFILELVGLKEMITRAIYILRETPGLEKYLNVYIEDLSKLDVLLKVCKDESSMKWDTVFATLRSIEFKRLPTAGRDANREQRDYVKKIRDEVKARIKNITEKIFFTNSAETYNDMKSIYPKIKSLSWLVSDFAKRYAIKKSQKSVVDFNDLEHFCLEILSEQDENGDIRPSKVAFGYRERFSEILVDEYQDSNLIQEMIISMVSKADSGKPNVFMVGDVKQSIYRFRQAKPELFLEKYNSYSTSHSSLYRKILLFNNFRSRKEVVDSVNFIFMQIMSESLGELDYTDIEALNQGAVYEENDKESCLVGGDVELHLIQTGGSSETFFDYEEDVPGEQDSAEVQPGEEEMLDSIQCEARLVAKRIQDLIQPNEEGKDFCVFDRGRKEYRKVDFRDIVILLRTMRKWSDIFLEELAVQGIPAFADTGAGFFKTTEVQVVLALLQVIDNPLQDIPLLAVLRSPIVSFNTDELAELRLADRKAGLYNALQVFAKGNKIPASRKASLFLSDLQRWRDISLYTATDQLLWQLYNETGYFAMVGAMPAGEQRQANLRILFERARQFEETSYKGLFNFINFIDRLKSSKGDMGSAKILAENDNVVRIMSIHKSKGLEFPVLILSGCGKKFNLQDMNKNILLHQELGFGPDVVDHKLRLAYPSVPKQAIRERIKVETLSEEMRILYVALTRAREKLIITGAVNDVRKAALKWAKCAAIKENKLSAYEMLKGSNYLDWIGPALLRHKDSDVLRESAGIKNMLQDFLVTDQSVWNIRIWDRTDVSGAKSSKSYNENDFIEWLDELYAGKDKDIPEEIVRRLSWEYQYINASKVPAKLSVTELKRRLHAETMGENGDFFFMPQLVKKPKFLEGKKGLNAAEAGTVLHFVMQRLNYKQGLVAQIEEMVVRELITTQQAQSVNTLKIKLFLDSSLGKRLLAAEIIKREVPFNMEIPCYELFPEMKGEIYRGETLLLQGIIDCYFEEADGIVLLDYKTDYVPTGELEMIKERYRLQIYYYSRALEILTGKKVKERYIYLFLSGELLEF